MARKIGVYGGTFDPIHYGHLVLAEQAREQLRLDEVRFIPAAIPPHKQTRAITAAKHRLEMVELATVGHAAFTVSEIELRREGVSYTAETLRLLQEEQPDDDFYLLLGADGLRDLPTWRQSEEILRLARVAVACRPGSPPPSVALLSPPLPRAEAEGICRRLVSMPLLDISATDMRQRLAEGRSIRYFTPPAVVAYIFAHGLYGTETPREESTREW